MSFTYNAATDLGKVRLEIGDTEEGEGVKPNGENLTDAEIQIWLDREESVGAACAAACEALARHWTRVATLSVGQRSEQLGAIAAQWAARGAELRAQYGGGAFTFVVTPGRADGYDDEAVTESEYT